jgi:hypothetical protein
MPMIRHTLIIGVWLAIVIYSCVSDTNDVQYSRVREGQTCILHFQSFQVSYIVKCTKTLQSEPGI